jgi:hypothetical protein
VGENNEAARTTGQGTSLLDRVDDTLLGRALWALHIDFDPSDEQPSLARLLAATVVSLATSLLADVLIAKCAIAVVAENKGYPHFAFSDYARLTVTGVVIACAAWPVVTRTTSSPRWVFSRMAVAVTLVLWLPDLYILYQGQPLHAVAFLMLMHPAIALLTYNCLVHIAPCRGLWGRR